MILHCSWISRTLDLLLLSFPLVLTFIVAYSFFFSLAGLPVPPTIIDYYPTGTDYFVQYDGVVLKCVAEGSPTPTYVTLFRNNTILFTCGTLNIRVTTVKVAQVAYMYISMHSGVM